VSCTKAECVKFPLFPRTLIVLWPLVAVGFTVIVRVEVAPAVELVTDEGLNEPLVCEGNPLTLRFTVLALLTALIVTV
jgi:hypothetical protein